MNCAIQRFKESFLLQSGDMAFDISSRAINDLRSRTNPIDFARGLTELLRQGTNEARVRNWGECKLTSDILNLPEHFHEDMMNAIRNIR